ncbi:MAG: stage II sporulation protein P [Eubacteriales bacterium]|nr:stage II sporulation protein P [Eubacteriales bacterium]
MVRRRYGRSGSRNRLNGGRIAVLTLMFWIVSGLVMISFIHGGPAQLIEANSEDVGKKYIGNVFPSVSRSLDYESRAALGHSVNEGSQKEIQGLLSEKQSGTLIQSMVGAVFPGAEVLDDDLAEIDPEVTFEVDSETNSDKSQTTADSKDKDKDPSGITSANIDYSKPVVIIYHTHATESYQPVTEGNFHTLDEYGTVREVGAVLAQELEAKGIQVIHNKTIHDSPSYNQSYTRSLETIKSLMENYESAKIIIDLHRDAAAYAGNKPKVFSINNNTIAGYAMVIGNGNPNVDALRNFANHINKTAEDIYPGFKGKIIEKQYKFNQYVSDYYVLLEVGNNENTIEQAKGTGKYFADVLAKAIKDIE